MSVPKSEITAKLLEKKFPAIRLVREASNKHIFGNSEFHWEKSIEISKSKCKFEIKQESTGSYSLSLLCFSDAWKECIVGELKGPMLDIHMVRGKVTGYCPSATHSLQVYERVASKLDAKVCTLQDASIIPVRTMECKGPNFMMRSNLINSIFYGVPMSFYERLGYRYDEREPLDSANTAIQSWSCEHVSKLVKSYDKEALFEMVCGKGGKFVDRIRELMGDESQVLLVVYAMMLVDRLDVSEVLELKSTRYMAKQI